MASPAPETDWTKVAENNLKAWIDASTGWTESFARLATLQAETMGRFTELSLAGWRAAFRIAADGETLREGVMFAEDQAAKVADAMQATLNDLKQAATPPPE